MIYEQTNPNSENILHPLVLLNERVFLQKPSIKVEDEGKSISVRGWNLSQHFPPTLSWLKTCESLTQLKLWNCGLNTKDLEVLASFVAESSMKHLYVDAMPQPDSIVFSKFLLEKSQLLLLSLRSNKISDATATKLANALAVNKSLRILQLWDNGIGNSAAVAFADALKLNTTLVSLSLGKNRIGDQGGIALSKLFRKYILSPDDFTQRKKFELERQEALKSKVRTNSALRRASAGKNKEVRESSENLSKIGDSKKKASPKKSAEKGKKEKEKAQPPKPEERKKRMSASKIKRGKVEEEEEETISFETMFELNGQWFSFGNRSLNHLDVSLNQLSEIFLLSLQESLQEQEMYLDLNEGIIGIFRVVLHGNRFQGDHPSVRIIETIMNVRNPYEDFIANDHAEQRSRTPSVLPNDDEIGGKGHLSGE